MVLVPSFPARRLPAGHRVGARARATATAPVPLTSPKTGDGSMSGMSPVSRARKKTPQPPAHSVNGVFKDVLRDFSDLGAEPTAVDVELLTSEVLGQWWDLPVEDGEELLGLELISFAQRKITPGAAALLAALRVVAETEVERKAAAAGLEVVLGRGIPEPEWAAQLGAVTAGECWRTGDVYGDEASLLFLFSRDGVAHGLLALLDFTDGGRVRDLAVVEQPQEVLAEMRVQSADEPDLVVLEQVEPAEAHRLLVDGLALTDRLEEAEVSEDYARFHAVALAWARALPEPAPSPEIVEWTPEAREAAVAEFLAETEIEDGRAVATLLVEHGVRTDPANPLRVGPEKLARFLEGLLGDEYELDAEYEETVEPVLQAWAQWAAAKAGLAEPAVEALEEALAEYLEEYAEEYADDDTALEAYFADGEELSADELTETLERRMFAVPSLSTEIGDEEVDLDPTDPEQRRLLVIGEHPEYHESLAEETFDGEEAQRLALKTSLVDQLWDNEPAEVWQAARRLQEADLDRDEIFDRLAEVLESQLREDTLDYDAEGYLEALRRI